MTTLAVQQERATRKQGPPAAKMNSRRRPFIRSLGLVIHRLSTSNTQAPTCHHHHKLLSTTHPFLPHTRSSPRRPPSPRPPCAPNPRLRRLCSTNHRLQQPPKPTRRVQRRSLPPISYRLPPTACFVDVVDTPHHITLTIWPARGITTFWYALSPHFSFSPITPIIHPLAPRHP